MGCVFPIVISTKQNIDTKIFTETEMVGIDNFMSEIYWNSYFIAAQCYKIKDNCLHQDNKSSILMENNGKALSTKQKNHINIWYFFITDRVKKGEL